MNDQDNIIALNSESQGEAPEAGGDEGTRAARKTTAAKKKTTSETSSKTSSETSSKTSSSTAKKTSSTVKKTSSAAKKTTSKTSSKTSSTSSTAKKKTSSAAKKTTSQTQPRLTAREKKLIQYYRKCGEAGKLMLDTMAEKTASMAGKEDGESGLGSAISSLASGIDLSSLTSLFGK